ncbi:hypothetical protein KBB48_00470 [Candidatus Shapirobacteria bacterium]|nr:hypothetical protein [Candidatus Shapirobacteria bacterium]
MPFQLLRLLPSRRTKNRIWLIFSDQLKLPFFADDVVKLGLKNNLEIGDELFGRIKAASLYYLLYNYSLRQIALSPKISQTLSPKLKQKLHFYLRKYQLSGEYLYLVDEIIDKLSSHQLLDEVSFSEHLLRQNRHRSRQYLYRLFSYYHLDFPEVYQSNDQESIRNILMKKKFSSLNLSEKAVKNKILASLARKGFAYNDIKTVIDELSKNS